MFGWAGVSLTIERKLARFLVPPDVQAISPPISKLRFAALTKGVKPAFNRYSWLADWQVTNSCHLQPAPSDASFRARSLLRSGQGSGSAGSPESKSKLFGLEAKVHNAARRGLNETISPRSFGDAPRAGSLILAVELFRTDVLYPRIVPASTLMLFCVLILRLGGRLSVSSVREAK